MRLINRYLIGSLASSAFFTLAALIGLFGFFDVVAELPSLGKGSYTAPVMLRYVAYLIPGHAYELMPLAVLIGGMVAMTQFASNSEYTVIRTSGVSLSQVAGVLAQFGVLFAILTVLLGEFAAPYAEQEASRVKLAATRSMVAQEFRSGIWVKDDKHFINVREMLPDTTLKGVRIYTYNDDYQLTQTRYADVGRYLGNGQWQLTGVSDTKLSENKVTVEHHPALNWKSVIEPDILDVLLVVPEQMSVANLVTYIEHLSNNKQQTQRYDIALWSKLFYPLACVSMALVALAFTPRQRRHGQLGLQLFIGICIGVGFHFTNRLFSHLGLLYGWNAMVSATLPTLLFLAAGIALIRKQEKR
ncbi:LPS export ABC transporter permease LptG [Crenobacter cavernae]|uniref:LPS export ABC transporter permease LptG n=1 Tax=Crenobacter cavernae TaxID=2290923 RepID=A0A345Y7V3_9NEIS|nr:LPS export ABC transporter permease LptG [Crenobacter cavernae]AXK40005.1 LPS export ABC transporter permease LptG [Crenobacter cavernae]